MHHNSIIQRMHSINLVLVIATHVAFLMLIALS